MATASASRGSGSPSLLSLRPKDKWGRAHLMNAFLSPAPSFQNSLLLPTSLPGAEIFHSMGDSFR